MSFSSRRFHDLFNLILLQCNGPDRGRQKLGKYRGACCNFIPKSIWQFINVATRQTHTTVGHDLESCTRDVRAVSCTHRDGSGRHVVLVDTPGFDDSSLSDSDILERIAQWLTTT